MDGEKNGKIMFVHTRKHTDRAGFSTLFGDFTYENAAEFVISTMAYIMNFILRS